MEDDEYEIYETMKKGEFYNEGLPDEETMLWRYNSIEWRKKGLSNGENNFVQRRISEKS